MPGTIATGAVSEKPVGLQDLAPTLLEFAGAAPLEPCHGRSLRPLLVGDRAPDWRRNYYVQNITHVSKIEQRAWRADNWKLIASSDGDHALYNLAADPEEELNVFETPRDDPGFDRYKHYASHADVVSRLRDDALQVADQLDDARGRDLLSLATPRR
jgi:choline-sulfatase